MGGQFSPVPRLVRNLLSDFYYVTSDGASAVIARPSPGEDQRLGGELGDDGAGGWAMGAV